MTTGHVFIATSLDGFIARKDHSLDWLTEHNHDIDGDGGFADFMDSVDGLVMGAGTFRTVLGFGPWPYEKPVVVLSQSLESHDVPEDLQSNVEICNHSPRTLMPVLEKRGWKRAYIDGGKLVQSFLREGLITDLTITHIPVLIGEGIPLFGALEGDLVLKLATSERVGPNVLQTRYVIA